MSLLHSAYRYTLLKLSLNALHFTISYTISKFQDDYFNNLFQTGGDFLEHFLNFSDTHMTVFLYEFKVWLKPKTMHTQKGYLSNFIGDLLFEFTLCQLSKCILTLSMLLSLG